jgi:signal transduction histidine kinase
VNNIISNAIKFSHPGQTINITAQRGTNDVRVLIEDHGVGIPDKILQHLFRTDQPTSRAGTGGERGTGYGMPVVKAYMNRYGGDIKVESRTAGADGGATGTKVTLTFQPIS